MASRSRTIPLTLIIPVHNRQGLLDRALSNVARQRTRPREVIVVDDGSAPRVMIDDSLRAGLAIRLMRHKRNRGPAAARNTGMRAAATDWVSFLDSDDFLLDDSLELRWSMLESDQRQNRDGRMLYGCGWVDCAAEGTPLAVRWPRPSSTPLDFASGCWFAPGSCLILNKTLAVEAAGYQDESLHRFEDFDWFLSLARMGFRLTTQPVAAVSIERRRLQDPARIEEAAETVRSKWRGRGIEKRALARLDAYMDVEVAAAYRFAGHRGRALGLLARSFLTVPRLSLQLSPAWEIQKLGTWPTASFSRLRSPSAESRGGA